MRARSRPSSSRCATSISRDGGGGYKAIFAEGVTPKPKDLETVGSGDGAAFQQMMKEMPGLAVETAAVGLRKNGGATGHWGPIRRHEAKLFPEADDLLQQVQSLMAAVPSDIVIPPDVPVVPVPCPCPCLRTTRCGCSSRSTCSAPTRRWPRTASADR